MNKVLEYKKIIVVLMIFVFSLFSFIPSKKANAEVLTLTSGVIVACAALAVSAGVVITNQDMIKDVGQRIYNGIKDFPSAITSDGEKVKINTTKALWDSVVNIAKNLPSASVIVNDFKNSILGNKAVSSFYTSSPGSTVGLFEYQQYSNATSPSFYFVDTNVVNGTYSTFGLVPGVDISDGKIHTISYSFSFNAGSSTYGSYSVYIDDNLVKTFKNVKWLEDYYLGFVVYDYGQKVTLRGAYDGSLVSIPYTKKNSENVSAEMPQKYFPTYGGSISVPLDTPLKDYNPSISAPITKPQDFVIDDSISIDYGDSVSDEVPGENVGDDVGVWDWLKSLINSIIDLLKSIANGITGIFEYLGSFISNLVKSLVDAFTGMLEYLFVPTVALEEIFALPSDSGFSQVVDFFNWDKFWSITPRPYEFRTNLNIFDLSNSGNDKEWDIEIKIFENKVVKDNLDLVRNVLSYSLLISVCWFVINHFLPQRDMD